MQFKAFAFNVSWKHYSVAFNKIDMNMLVLIECDPTKSYFIAPVGSVMSHVSYQSIYGCACFSSLCMMYCVKTNCSKIHASFLKVSNTNSTAS